MIATGEIALPGAEGLQSVAVPEVVDANERWRKRRPAKSTDNRPTASEADGGFSWERTDLVEALKKAV
mgnify:CR=1 FL=1